MTRLKAWRRQDISPAEIEAYVLNDLSSVIPEQAQITKKGKAPMSFSLPSSVDNSQEACSYYMNLFKLASFRLLIRNYVFSEMCREHDYEYPVYAVDEVGYKLSKRKERVRPNQLCKFRALASGKETPNLHLATEQVELALDLEMPERIIDFIRRDAKWS